MVLPYTADEIYAVVSDVAAYADFLPGIISSEVWSKTDTSMEARLVMGKGAIRQSLITRSRLVAGELIEMSMLEGPFSRFSGRWTFEALQSGNEPACRVTIEADYEFSSIMLNMTLGKLIQANTDKVIEAFNRRAARLYRNQ